MNDSALLKEMVSGHKIASLLDLGCYHGELKAEFPDAKYTGVDAVDYDIYTKKPLKRKPDLIMDLNKGKLPFKDKSFDLVVMAHIIEHMWDVRTLLDESRRLSKKLILIGVPNAKAIDNRILSLLGTDRSLSKDDFNPQDWCGHHQYFWHYRSLNMIKHRFPDFKLIRQKAICECSGSRYVPHFIKDRLADRFPNIFSTEVYYLLERT